jgi:mannosidase alpha-like ER degradation enhancer 2
MLLMKLDSPAAEAKRIILSRLRFDQDTSVQVFEVTIRLLGGLLSAYQMNGDPAFLKLADDLGGRLLPAFETPTGMPYRYVNLRTGAIRDPVSNPAEIGTLMLEFGTLSKLTHKPVYYAKAKKAVTALYALRSRIGLVGTWIDVRTGKWTDQDSHVSGAIDSYYEYLLKSWLLFGDEDFHRMWRQSAKSIDRYLADARFGGLWYSHVNMMTGARTATHFGALDAFFPAVLALSGDMKNAKALFTSVASMWNWFGIEPEEFDYSNHQITDAGYPLRPESIESAYYLYRLTGEKYYRTEGLDMFSRVVDAARTDAGFASISDVRTKKQRDQQPSFLLAETFKYAYLIAAPAETLDLHAIVFNTEAHPLRRTW